MNCPTCGSQIPDGSTMCGVCGAAIQAQPMQQNAYAQPAMQQPMMQQPMMGMPAATPSMKAKKSFNLGNYALWVGCLITAISVFLTYISLSAFGYTESTSLMGTDGEFTDGYIILTGVVIIAVLNIFKLNIVTTILSVLELGMAFLEKSSVDDNLGYLSSLATLDYGPGFYLLWVGTIVMIGGAVAAIILAGSKKKI